MRTVSVETQTQVILSIILNTLRNITRLHADRSASLNTSLEYVAVDSITTQVNVLLEYFSAAAVQFSQPHDFSHFSPAAHLEICGAFVTGKVSNILTNFA